jgi:hypothetical protein
MADAPTTETNSGLRPSRIEGRTNKRRTTSVAASPANAATPRKRPSAMTTNAKSSANQKRGAFRSRSTMR